MDEKEPQAKRAEGMVEGMAQDGPQGRTDTQSPSSTTSSVLRIRSQSLGRKLIIGPCPSNQGLPDPPLGSSARAQQPEPHAQPL